MKYLKDFGYMSLIQTVSDVNNAFLSRRELTCDFAGLGGKLKTMEAIDMILSLINISEPTRLGMISYAVSCLKKKKKKLPL